MWLQNYIKKKYPQWFLPIIIRFLYQFISSYAFYIHRQCINAPHLLFIYAIIMQVICVLMRYKKPPDMGGFLYLVTRK